MPMPKAGDQAPDFRLPDASGKETALADFRGQRVILFFFVKANTSG
jgi:peroxiredoxin Q/BCP